MTTIFVVARGALDAIRVMSRFGYMKTSRSPMGREVSAKVERASLVAGSRTELYQFCCSMCQRDKVQQAFWGKSILVAYLCVRVCILT